MVKAFSDLTRGMSRSDLLDESRLGELQVTSHISKTFSDKESRAKRQKRRRGDIRRIVVHRLGPTIGVVPAQIIDAFKDTGKYKAGSFTGGRFPYCLGIDPWAAVSQYARILDITPHAGSYNEESIGVFVSGDFRKYPPTWVADIALRRLCVALAGWIGPDYSLDGHTELGAGATGDPTKVCPGPHLAMNGVRRVVRERTEALGPLAPDERDLILLNAGIVI